MLVSLLVDYSWLWKQMIKVTLSVFVGAGAYAYLIVKWCEKIDKENKK